MERNDERQKSHIKMPLVVHQEPLWDVPASLSAHSSTVYLYNHCTYFTGIWREFNEIVYAKLLASRLGNKPLK